MIAPSKTRPSATSVAVVYHVSPPSHVWSTTIQVLASTTLAKVEGILSEEPMAISGASGGLSSASPDNNPSVTSVRAMVPKQHPCMTTTLKELKSHKTPPCTNTPSGNTTAPAMQAIVVNCVSIVEP
jgi:hypothetical protein